MTRIGQQLHGERRVKREEDRRAGGIGAERDGTAGEVVGDGHPDQSRGSDNRRSEKEWLGSTGSIGEPTDQHRDRQRHRVRDDHHRPHPRRDRDRRDRRRDAFEIIEEIDEQRAAGDLDEQACGPCQRQISPQHRLDRLGRRRWHNRVRARAKQRDRTGYHHGWNDRQSCHFAQHGDRRQRSGECRRDGVRHREQPSRHALLRVRDFFGHDSQQRREEGVHRNLERGNGEN